MASTDLNFADVDELVTLLKAAGVRSVSTDPAEVNTPGVLVQITGVDLNLLGGLTISTNLLLLAPDIAPRRAATQLQDLFNQVVPVLRGLGGPTDKSTLGKWVLPGDTTPLPGIAVPFDLLTTQE